MSNESKHIKVWSEDDLWPSYILPFVSRAFSFSEPANARMERGNMSLRRATFEDIFFFSAFADRFHIFTYAPYMTHNRKRCCSWADTLSNVHTPTHAAPPTLLEDGQCYRGNQFKQGLDGREVVRLAGKDVHHLKQQDVTSDTDGVGGRSRLIRRKRGNFRWPSAHVRHSHKINVGFRFIIAVSLRVWIAEKPSTCFHSAKVGFWLCVCGHNRAVQPWIMLF